jgi:hypothetical protein
MIQAALSQVETRTIPLTVITGLPQVITTLAFVTVQWQFKVPTNEQWIFLAGGARAIIDNNLLRPVGSALVITTMDGTITVLPAVQTNLLGVLSLVVSVSLQGVELPPGANVDVYLDITNTDVVDRNVTAMQGGVIVRPLRLVSEVAVANLSLERVDRNLNERLMRSRG